MRSTAMSTGARRLRDTDRAGPESCRTSSSASWVPTVARITHRLTTPAHHPLVRSGNYSVPMTAVQMASYYDYPRPRRHRAVHRDHRVRRRVLHPGHQRVLSALGKTPSIVDVPMNGGIEQPHAGHRSHKQHPDLENRGSRAGRRGRGIHGTRRQPAVLLRREQHPPTAGLVRERGDRRQRNNPSVLSIRLGRAGVSVPGRSSPPSIWRAFLCRSGGHHRAYRLGRPGVPRHAAARCRPMSRWPTSTSKLLSSPIATASAAPCLQPNGSGGVARQGASPTTTPPGASGGGAHNTATRFRRASPDAEINPVSANPPGNTGRGVPDVSANADSYQVCIRGQNVTVGGTSTARRRGRPVRPRHRGSAAVPGCAGGVFGRYAAGALNDITTGDNGAYAAGAGWDACAGLGSPNGTAILTGWRTARQVAPTVTGLCRSSRQRQ